MVNTFALLLCAYGFLWLANRRTAITLAGCTSTGHILITGAYAFACMGCLAATIYSLAYWIVESR